MPACPACGVAVLEIDVKCPSCGVAIGATGAHRMLGQVVLGQYELIDVLGQGGMSVVFKGKHKLTDQEVALKILPPELAAHSQVKSRFLEEAKALAALDHPNIVHLYNFGQENGFFVLAMQFVQGRTWERIILENKRMDWKASCKIACDVLRALEYAHGRGVIHRDMKPSNVLVRAHDAMATVMDFGIAKMTTSTKLTATGQTMGTVRYMSPEQVRGQEVDLRTDLYSLGATLYEAVVGDTPFDGSTHFEIMTKHLSEVPKRPSLHGIEIPQSVEDALMRSLAKKPDDRFENAREMRKILEAALRDGDLGLVETQKLNREILGEVRTKQQTPTATPRVATATAGGSLADELEPAATGAVPAKRKLGMWIALGAVILAGGTAGAIVLFKGKEPAPTGWQPTITEIKGVTPIAGEKIDGITIETVGLVAPKEMMQRYHEAVDKLRAYAKDRAIAFHDPVPIQQMIAVPAAAFCEPTTYQDLQVPTGCGSFLGRAEIGAHGDHRLVLIADPAKLQRGMEVAVADAVCAWDPAPVEKLCLTTDAFKLAPDASGPAHEGSASGSAGNGSAATGSAGSAADPPKPPKGRPKPGTRAN